MEPTFKTLDVDWAEPLQQDCAGLLSGDVLLKLFGRPQNDLVVRYVGPAASDQKTSSIAGGVDPRNVFVDAVNRAFYELRAKPISYPYGGLVVNQTDPDWKAVQFLGAGLLEFQDLAEEHLESEFRRHARQWSGETAHLSSETQIVLHPSYQRIIGMGPAVLPFIFRDLKEQPRDWFWALNAITGEDPVSPEDAGVVPRIVEAWLRWGGEHGYI
jgi:hypothetical protein